MYQYHFVSHYKVVIGKPHLFDLLAAPLADELITANPGVLYSSCVFIIWLKEQEEYKCADDSLALWCFCS